MIEFLVSAAPFLGLFVIGPAMLVIVPYLRHALEKVAESGDIKDWPLPNWSYMALFFLPVLEFGVAFAITEGLIEVVAGWTLIQAIAFAYAGSHLGKEVINGGAALLKISRHALK